MFGEEQMKRIIFTGVLIIMLLSGIKLDAAVSSVANGSFEADGHRILDIRVDEPNGWDVNIPQVKFGGMVDDNWKTDGKYSLTILSNAYQQFKVNDIAFVYQDVVLSDVNTIVFDVHLNTQPPGSVWNPLLRSSVVMIDDAVVWQSPAEGTDIRGTYLNQAVKINVKDKYLHRLAFGLRADVNEASTTVKYSSDWDRIAFDIHCGGAGFLDTDFNRDCSVDFNDFALLADKWLAEVDPNIQVNLSHVGDVNDSYGIIDFKDIAVLAEGWPGIEMAPLSSLCSVWLQQAAPSDPNNLFKGDDVQIHGVIDWLDLVIFVEDWLQGGFD